MSNPDSYVREIDSLTTEIKRLNERLKQLRKQKKGTEGHLYNYMTRQNIEKYGNVTRKSITPREKKSRKPDTVKRQDAIALFREVGIPNPEEFWEEFKSTQKYESEEEL